MAIFRDDFSVDRLADYVLMFGDAPGVVADGALTGPSFDYVNPHAAMVPGGRVIAKIIHPAGWYSQNLVGYSSPDADGTHISFLRISPRGPNADFGVMLANGSGPGGGDVFRDDSRGGYVPIDLTGTTFWISFEETPDRSRVIGGVWSFEPPVSGGTPDIFEIDTYMTAADMPLPLYPYIGGTGTTDPVETQKLFYDDWSAEVVGAAVCPPRPPWPYEDGSIALASLGAGALRLG